ncbi:MAG: subclass B3 metallo-beta-lactamase [Croceibacterium sp.]
MFARVLAVIAAGLLAGAASGPNAALPAGPPAREFTAACEGKDGWADPAPPVRIFANVYHVGTCGITALLVASGEGHILLDTGPVESADSVAANIRTLGFKLSDVKWIVTSHEHLDHVGGLARLKALTGAQVAATPLARVPLETGQPDWRDPQAGSIGGFAGVTVERVLRDGEHLRLGPLDLTAHTTTGHAPGSTSWTWRSCAGADCKAIAYVDSVSAVSSDTYKFSAQRVYVDAFARSLGKIASLPCDVLITPHPGASALHERIAGTRPLADPDACLHYAEAGQAGLERRIQSEGARR